MKKPLLLTFALETALVAAVTFSAQAANAADTTVTATVAAGGLTITAPTTLNLGSITPGEAGTATLTGVKVTDARAATGGWLASVEISNFTSATTTTTIPAADATYTPTAAVTTGTASVAPATITGGAAATVQTATAVSGNNTATWDGALSLAVPADALAANDYTATITHSVA